MPEEAGTIQADNQTAANLTLEGKMTLREFIEYLWLPNLHRREVKPSTLSSYGSMLEHHVYPWLGGQQVDAITPTQIELALNQLTKYAAKYQRNVALLLRAVFNHAVERGAITKSPIREFHMPKISKTEKSIWTEAELKAILEKVDPEHKPLFHVVALTGMRLGEVLGLQWKHVDFNKGWIKVEQSLWSGHTFKPKNDASMRVLPMAVQLYKTMQALDKASQHDPDDFIFTNRRGKPWSPDVLRRDVLYPVLWQLGYKWKKGEGGFHRFRHSAGSIVVSNTGNLKLAQKLLGHSSISTTANIYTHVRPEEQKKAAEVLEEAVLGKQVTTHVTPAAEPLRGRDSNPRPLGYEEKRRWVH